MKKTRHFIKRKLQKARRTLLRIRAHRPALFVVLVALTFSFGGLLVWGGATITSTLFSGGSVDGLALHYTFDGGDLSGPSPDILFVVASDPLNSADEYLYDIMTLGMGSDVTVRLASASAPTDLTPYDVVVVSESSSSVDVASKYNNAEIGVVNMENASWAAHDLVGGDTTVSATTNVNVVGGDHPVAAGYSGTTALFTSAAQMRRNSTTLPTGAVSILQEVGDSSRHIAFAYEEGATMLNAHVAEARRVALGFHSDTYSVFSDPAEDIFTASIYWAADTTLEESITIKESGLQFSGSTTLAAPVGEGPSNHGPYVIHGRQWLLYSDGAAGLAYVTKDIQGGAWSSPTSLSLTSIYQGRYFNMTFDGTHFHVLYRVSGDGRYIRLTPNPDGTMTSGSAQTVYSDATWDLDWSTFYITTDYQGRPWVQFQLTDGTNYKPVVSASTATDGTWSTRSGFPYDLQGSSTQDSHGNHVSIVELGNEEMFFMWRDDINNRTSARVWNNGSWSSVENTGLSVVGFGRTSAISPVPGEVLVNEEAIVAHRATNGTWSYRSPGGMNNSSDNSFSKAGSTVRLWDSSGGSIRYKETNDAGQTWGALTTFATATNLNTFTATSEIGDYHTVVWGEGSNPFIRFSGIDGEIISGSALGRVIDRSSNENHGTVQGGVVTSGGRIGQAAEFDGIDDYITTPDDASLSALDDLTIEAWIKLDSFSSSGFSKIAMKSDSGGTDQEYWLEIGSNDQVCMGWTNSSSTDYNACSSTALSLNQWYHVVGLKNGTSLDIYINGVSDTGWTNGPTSGSSYDSDGPLYVGVRVNEDYFDGIIDGLRIYNRALSADEINRTYHLGATTTINTSFNPPELQIGLVGYWPFNGLEMNWVAETTNAAWPARTRAQGVLSYNNLLWIMGGWDGSNSLGDVWYSADGESWTLATNSPAWGTKATHETLVYDDRMWVIGGGNKAVHYSTDGVTWTQATASAGWTGTYRNQHQVLSYDGRMWMMGGTTGTDQNDVWYSTDGVTWTQATANAAWSDRQNHKAVVYDGRMWVIGGGTMRDVWYSTDGVTWTQATSNGGWGGTARYRFGLLVYDDKMWIIGGNNGSGATSDVWWSTDGVTWKQETNAAPWGPLEEHGAVVHDNRMWIMGGMSSLGNSNDVWSKEIGTVMTDWSGSNNNGIYTYGDVDPGSQVTVASRVNSSSDDAEQAAGGSVDLTSSDIELINDGGGNAQTVGLRFTNISVPAGATITDASVQFTVDDDLDSGTTSVTIYGQDIDDAPTFTTATNNVSSRTYTTASVDWNNIPAWGTQGLAGPDQKTPNLSSVIQEIVDRGGWVSGNDIALIIEGTGERTAVSYNGIPADAPLLSVTYEVPGTAGGGVVPGRIGQGLEFSSAANNLATIPDDDSLDIGSGSFTYGAWIKVNSFVDDYDMPIYKGGASAGDTGWDMELGADSWGAGISDGSMVRIVFFNDNDFSPPYLNAGEWYHLMAVVDRSNDEFRSYRDGVLINTTSITGFGTSNSTYDLTLGGRVHASFPNLFDGVIDDLRVYNRALPADEIDRLYHLGATTKVNTTPSAEGSAGGPIAHWTFDGSTISGSTVEDVAGTADGTISDASATPGRIGQGLSFDGNDSVEVSDQAILRLGQNHSLSAWVRREFSSCSGYRGILGKIDYNQNQRSYGLEVQEGCKLRFLLSSTGSGNSVLDSAVDVPLREWAHVAATYNGSTMSIYMDGVEIGSKSESSLTPHASDTSLWIGAHGSNDTASIPWEGKIDDVRVYGRTLSAEEVQRLASLAPVSGGSIGVNPDPAPEATGFITVDRWDGVAGTAIADIPLGTSPDYTGTLSTMESPFSADTYAVRIRGYIYPETTGDYSFWIASDDSGELNLSTDDTEGNKTTIAYHTGYTSSRQWNKYTTQQSTPITLVAGQRYYIEALMKENGGGDNLAVAWRLNNTTDPTNGSAADIIPGSVLSEWE